MPRSNLIHSISPWGQQECPGNDVGFTQAEPIRNPQGIRARLPLLNAGKSMGSIPRLITADIPDGPDDSTPGMGCEGLGLGQGAWRRVVEYVGLVGALSPVRAALNRLAECGYQLPQRQVFKAQLTP
jgi:hypothetical protein